MSLLSLIDTEEDNYFPPLSSELLPFIIRYADDLFGEVGVYGRVLKEVMNKRLGIKDVKMYH